MNFEEVLQARKSIRSYIDKPVEEEKLHAILDAAKLAPPGKIRRLRAVMLRGVRHCTRCERRFLRSISEIRNMRLFLS